MNTRKEFPTFEELWTCCSQEESRITSQNQKEEDSKAYATRFKKNGSKKKFGFQNKKSERKEKEICQRYNAMVAMNMATTKIMS
jgi:exopolysaccharide biosynthesis protein